MRLPRWIPARLDGVEWDLVFDGQLGGDALGRHLRDVAVRHPVGPWLLEIRELLRTPAQPTA